MNSKKRGLGKGLDALLSTSAVARNRDALGTPASPASTASVPGSDLQQLPIEWLQPGKYQPRRDMSADALDELASSIKAQGVIQPIVIRPLAEQQYEIIAGERRWRAAQQIKLETVPCIVKAVADEEAVAIALIENIQREDLNAMEEAIALQRLMSEFELTQQQVADAVGKSRSTVTNLLRLHNLNEDVKRLLEHGDLEMGHARALLSLSGEQQSITAQSVAQRGLSVRETEKLVSKLVTPGQRKQVKQADPDVIRLQRSLSESLGASVSIKQGSKGKGKLVIDYNSSAQLDHIIANFMAPEE